MAALATIGPLPYDTASSIMPALSGIAISVSDTVNNPFICRGLYVGATGNYAVVFPDGSAVTLVGLVAGIIHPITFIRINNTNTTVTTNIVGFA